MTDRFRLLAETRLQQLYSKRFFSAPFNHQFGLVETVAGALERQPSTLNLLYLWGVHEKPSLDSRDEKAIVQLSRVLDRIGERVGAVCRMWFVVCDAHALVNRVEVGAAASYAKAIRSRAAREDWMVLAMSDIWAEAGLTVGAVDRMAADIPTEGTPALVLQGSEKHYRGGDAARGAACYMAARLAERALLEAKFAGAVFLTASDPRVDFLQPRLPRLSVWTYGRGRSEKPWFSGGVE